METISRRFLDISIKHEALLFGDFKLKSGLSSSYFFNIGILFNSGYLNELASLYADKILEEDIKFDTLFGPSYKGIPLVSGISIELSRRLSKPIPISFDRKEEKKHGEGGKIVGSVKDKKVLIIDDVLTAGTALKNTIKIVKFEGGHVINSIVALDREEVIDGRVSRDRIREEHGLNILSLARLSDLIEFLEQNKKVKEAESLKSNL